MNALSLPRKDDPSEAVAEQGLTLASRARCWLDEAALPLWSGPGFDERNGIFHERLDFQGRPDLAAPRRLMVQARQIAVFARAALEDGFEAGRSIAIRAAENMIGRWLRADGKPGWVFSIRDDGRLVDDCRDLYAHAFVIYGLVWVSRLEHKPHIEAAIKETLEFLDEAFFDPIAGGYWDRLPIDRGLRSQNPHMHLFEALLELYEIDHDPAVLDRCRELHSLAERHFVSGDGDVLREDFRADWSTYPEAGSGRVEPGHLMEWAWLFRRFEAATNRAPGHGSTRLVATALSHGCVRASGRFVDEIGENREIRRASSRSWPHAEACKALAVEIQQGRSELKGDLVVIGRRLLEAHCRTEYNGGWIDHLDSNDVPISKFMPASSLYHIYNGLKSLESIFPANKRDPRIYVEG